MPLFEMAEANVIVGLVHLFRHGKFLDDFPHHFEALTVVASFKKAHAHFQCGFGALLAVAVILAGHRLEMRARFFVGVALGEMMCAQLEVRLKPGFAARIPLDDRPPNLDGFFLLTSIIAQIASLSELARGTVFNDGSAHRRRGVQGK